MKKDLGRNGDGKKGRQNPERPEKEKMPSIVRGGKKELASTPVRAKSRILKPDQPGGKEKKS